MNINESITYQKHVIPYIGESAAIFVEKETRGLIFHLKVTRARDSKYGDYRPSVNGKPQRITINGNLDKYSFIITFLHELAHLKAFNNYGRNIKPHGAEWENTFSQYILKAIENEIFPKEIAETINWYYLINFDFSNNSRSQILNSINKYLNIPLPTRLSSFPINSCVLLKNGMKIKIIERKRSRYLCKELTNNKMYLVHKQAEVEKILQ